MSSDNTRRDETVYELSLPGMQEIYQRELLQDFPPNEVKPFSSMKALWEKNMYRGYAMERDGELCAYWFLLYYEKYKLYLLDYLAVVRGKRGRGYGSCALRHLISDCQDALVLIEAENPAMAKNLEERFIRERRICFYQENGARLTGVCTTVYDAPYVLFLAGEGSAIRDDTWVGEAYEQLYRETILPENGHSPEEAGLQIWKGERNHGADHTDCR